MEKNATQILQEAKANHLIANPNSPGEFILPETSNERNVMNFLYPENWVFHNAVVEKVLTGDYMGIRPYSAEFVPTLNCTNRCRGPCSYCLQRMNEGIATKNDFTNPRTHIQNLDLAKGLIDKLIEGGIKGITFTGGGEPTLYRHIENLLEHTHKRGTQTVLYTNGNTVSKSRIQKIARASPRLVRLSLNCGTKEGYNYFHNPANPENAFENALASIETFAKESVINPEMVFGVGFIMNQDNWMEIPQTAERLREIVDKTRGGIAFASYRPAFNYCGTKQTDPLIAEKAYELVETEARRILRDSGITVSNIKCRYETIKGEERGYSICRASGLFAEVSPNGELHTCCDRNCFRPFRIGDLKKNSIEEIYSGEERKIALNYANEYDCTTCPIACKPHETNKQFEKIEQLRARGEMQKVVAWVNYFNELSRPRMVNF